MKTEEQLISVNESCYHKFTFVIGNTAHPNYESKNPGRHREGIEWLSNHYHHSVMIIMNNSTQFMWFVRR